ncbi:MAG: prolyl-tRNA synthetase associated domain-containing protein [Pseudomonadota bacterium]
MTQPKFTRQTLLDQLSQWEIETSTIDHEAVFTVEQSQALHREIEGVHTKNLFLKDKKGALFLVTADHETQVDLKGLHPKLGAGRLSFGSAERLMNHLGVTPGSVTAFALINDGAGEVRFILDKNLADAEIINCHPLENTATTSIKRADLSKFVENTGHSVEVVDLEASAN